MIARFARSRLHYAWIIAAITFLTLITTAGVRSMPGVLMVPLQDQFGWSRATISLAVALNLVLYGLCGPFAAALMDRFGIRRVMACALAVVALAVALTTRMQASWQLDLLWGGMVGIATGATASVLAAVVANRWFVARRGLVVGLLTASNATGQLIFLPILSALVVTLGWRAAAATVAGVALLVLVPVTLLMRDRPRDLGIGAYGATVDEESAAPPANPFKTALSSLAQGLRTPDFWLLAGSFYICGASTNGLIGTHLIPASMEHGIPEVQAATMLAVIGVFDVIGTTISGWLSDRVDNRWLLCWYYSLRGLSLLFLPYALGSSFLYLAVFVVFYGLDWVATVPPTVRLAGQIFGRARTGVVYGWIFAAHQLGAATAAFGAGAVHTWLGDYQVAFLSAGVLCLMAAGLVIRIGRLPGSIALPAVVLEAEAATA